MRSFHMSVEEKAEVWRRTREGMSVRALSRAMGRATGSIHNYMLASGGVRPPVRCRAGNRLSLTEREEIFRALAAGESLRAVAKRLGRAPSTVCREVTRN